VRMPKKYRFDTGEISIRREGRAVVLEPLAQDWVWLDSLTGPLDDDFVEAALEGR
ncbi:AbrB/MazE/SpoVT family DNA-binding domain-containing protein, partial [Mesorhizobium sp. M7A.F.Ca.CA.002.05.1.1]